MQSVAVVVAQRVAGSAANVAVTVLAASIVNAHVVAVPLTVPAPAREAVGGVVPARRERDLVALVVRRGPRQA